MVLDKMKRRPATAGRQQLDAQPAFFSAALLVSMTAIS